MSPPAGHLTPDVGTENLPTPTVEINNEQFSIQDVHHAQSRDHPLLSDHTLDSKYLREESKHVVDAVEVSGGGSFDIHENTQETNNTIDINHSRLSAAPKPYIVT